MGAVSFSGDEGNPMLEEGDREVIPMGF